MSQITTHVLDTALGKPAANIELSLYRLVSFTPGAESVAESHDPSDSQARWTRLGGGTTNRDGRVQALLDDGVTLPAGTYRMHFSTGNYFHDQGLAAFYPFVDVVFNLGDNGEHHHIPLLLSPFAYSTYRGS